MSACVIFEILLFQLLLRGRKITDLESASAVPPLFIPFHNLINTWKQLLGSILVFKIQFVDFITAVVHVSLAAEL